MKLKTVYRCEDICPKCKSDNIEIIDVDYRGDGSNTSWEEIECSNCGYLSRQEFEVVYKRSKIYYGETPNEKNYMYNLW